jgi:hypothetical protein
VGALNALADAFRDRAGAGTLVPVSDPVIKTHSTLEVLEAAGDRQSAA